MEHACSPACIHAHTKLWKTESFKNMLTNKSFALLNNPTKHFNNKSRINRYRLKKSYRTMDQPVDLTLNTEQLTEDRILAKRGRGRNVGYLIKFRELVETRWMPRNEIRSQELIRDYERSRNALRRQQCRARARARQQLASTSALPTPNEDLARAGSSSTPLESSLMSGKCIPVVTREECIVCWFGEAEYAFVPCGHLISCSDCLDKMKGRVAAREDSQLLCPLCRGLTTNTLKIFRN